MKGGGGFLGIESLGGRIVAVCWCGSMVVKLEYFEDMILGFRTSNVVLKWVVR